MGKTLFPGTVPVHPCNAHFRVCLAEFLGKPLCPEPECLDPFKTAGRAQGFRCRLEIAVMAGQAVIFQMVDHGQIAVAASYGLTAKPAEMHPVKSAPVEKQDGLFAFFKGRIEGLFQSPADNLTLLLDARVLLHVHYVYSGQGPLLDTIRHTEHPVSPGGTIIKRLDGGGP